MKIIATSQLVFQGSADTQVYLLNDNQQNFLISFSGFLPSTSAGLESFKCSELNIYTGANVKDIIATITKRSEGNPVSKQHSFRRFELTESLKIMIVDWLFTAEELINLG